MGREPTKPPRGKKKKPNPPKGPPNVQVRKGAESRLKLVGGDGESELIREQLKLLQPIVDIIKASNVHTVAVLLMGHDGVTDVHCSTSDHCTLASMADQFDDWQREFRDDVLHPEMGDE
jgi:hypothetical protein